MTDLEAGIRLNRLQVDSLQVAIDLILGTGLMAMRSILEGRTEPDYPEQIAKVILKTLGVADAELMRSLLNFYSPCKLIELP